MKPLEALERIKNAPTIYVGCASDIYTRYSFECKLIEKALEALEVIKKFGNYQVIEIQGQWYIIQGTSFDKSAKLPISGEQAKMLKEVLSYERISKKCGNR